MEGPRPLLVSAGPTHIGVQPRATDHIRLARKLGKIEVGLVTLDAYATGDDVGGVLVEGKTGGRAAELLRPRALRGLLHHTRAVVVERTHPRVLKLPRLDRGIVGVCGAAEAGQGLRTTAHAHRVVHALPSTRGAWPHQPA